MSCPRLLKTFHTERKKVLFYRRILVNIILSTWKRSNNPLIGKSEPVPLHIPATKNRSNKFGRFQVGSNQLVFLFRRDNKGIIATCLYPIVNCKIPLTKYDTT